MVKVIALVTSPSSTKVALPVALISDTSPATKPSPVTVTSGLVSGVPSYSLLAVSEVSVTVRLLMVSLPSMEFPKV